MLFLSLITLITLITLDMPKALLGNDYRGHKTTDTLQ
jgi:hypothetical protein